MANKIPHLRKQGSATQLIVKGEPYLFLAPDIYQPNFEAWCKGYTRRGNPLFIPGMRGNVDGARQVFYSSKLIE